MSIHDKEIQAKDSLLRIKKTTGCFCAAAIFVSMIILIRKFLTDASFYSQWSFVLEDKPWTPSQFNPRPIILNHYFGDFQLPISYLSSDNVYNQYDLIPNGFAPFGMLLVKLFSIMPLEISYLIFTLLSIGITYQAIYLNLSKWNLNTRNTITALLTVTSLPLFIIIDRGNFIGISVGFFFAAFAIVRNAEFVSGRIRIISIFMFVLSVSIKIYMLALLILLLYFFSDEKRKVIKDSLFSLFVSNILTAPIFGSTPTNALKTLMAYLNLQSGGQTGQFNLGWLFGGVNINQAIMKTFYGDCIFNESICFPSYLKWLPTISSIFWFFVVLLLILRVNKNEDLKIIALASCLIGIPSVSMAYTLIWSTYSIAILLSTLETRKFILSEKVLITLLFWFSLPNFTPGLFKVHFGYWTLEDWKLINGTLLIFLFPILYWIVHSRMKYSLKVKI